MPPESSGSSLSQHSHTALILSQPTHTAHHIDKRQWARSISATQARKAFIRIAQSTSAQHDVCGRAHRRPVDAARTGSMQSGSCPHLLPPCPHEARATGAPVRAGCARTRHTRALIGTLAPRYRQHLARAHAPTAHIHPRGVCAAQMGLIADDADCARGSTCVGARTAEASCARSNKCARMHSELLSCSLPYGEPKGESRARSTNTWPRQEHKCATHSSGSGNHLARSCVATDSARARSVAARHAGMYGRANARARRILSPRSSRAHPRGWMARKWPAWALLQRLLNHIFVPPPSCAVMQRQPSAGQKRLARCCCAHEDGTPSTGHASSAR